MYLIDKHGRRFETKEAHEEFLRQADAIGQWEQKNRIPDHRRMTWFHPDYGVYVPNPWISPEDVKKEYDRINGNRMDRTAAILQEKPGSRKNKSRGRER